MEDSRVLEQLRERFPVLAGEGAVTAKRRIFLAVPLGLLLDVLRYLNDALGFTSLCTITGLDTGDSYEFIYHVAHDDGVMLNVKTKAPKDAPAVPTVLDIYNGATFYERELEAMLGVTVIGLPEGRQYPLPDNWPKGQYPLRKDWTLDMLKNDPEGAR
ncbi:MAG TPA: NADH-quinone oxidoreductase subunit C [Feifaniaceae bacterium]|nr:NADH-quinone oxidoreductase subunit C [Feifaniaceae bacterium]